MKIQKISHQWYRAEQTVPNGLLTYSLQSYARTHLKALKKLLKKLS